MRLFPFRSGSLAAALALILGTSAATRADEPCQSPYLAKITGQEDFIYVFTLGIEGLGDGSDKLVTVGVNPARPDYGKVVASTSVGGRHEVHHGGFTDDRRFLWMGGLEDSSIFVFDVAADPAKPKLVKTITTFEKDSGGIAGPHTFYAIPGRMLISALSNSEDDGGRTALVEYSNEGEHVRTIPMPQDAPYGYDVRVNADLNRMLTSSFTGRRNYMRKLPELIGDAQAMQNFGNTVVVWDFHARKPLQTLAVPGAPLEIRWALSPQRYHAFTSSALTSKLWGVFRTAEGTFEATELADIGDPSKTPLPVDISISADDRFLFVDSFMDGMVRVFDVSDPRKPKLTHEQKIGAQLNMVSQSWDSKRVYFTSSLLANWDKGGADDEQFLKGYDWDGSALTQRFAIDFRAEKLGRAHQMNFGSIDFYRGRVASRGGVAAAAPR
jgi:selenium-binding protein 1